MTRVNRKDETIEITEILSFENVIKPIFERYVECLDDEYANKENAEEEMAQLLKRLKSEGLNHFERIDLLSRLLEEWERMDDGIQNISIFDHDLIEKVIEEWFEDQTF